MKRFIFVVCILFCLSACKKEHVDPMSASTTLNRLPKKVLVKKGDTYTIQRYKYNDRGQVTKFWMYDSLTPNDQDSILYSYDIRNQLTIKRYYIDDTYKSNTHSFNNLGRLKFYGASDTFYIYHYTAAGEVDYFIRSNVTMSVKDSIKMYPGAAWTYAGNGDGTYGTYDPSSDRYMASKIEYFFNTDNGAYQDRGTWSPSGFIWGDPSANTTVCIDKEIEFQDEVAYTIVPIGQAGYYNMFARTRPYKYATSGEYIFGPFFNYSHYEASYTFDAQDRLKVIEMEGIGMPDNDTPDPNAIPAVLHFTSTIYY